MNCTTIKHQGRDIEVKELTVEQLDAVLSAAKQPLTVIDRIFNADMVSEHMLSLCTGLDIAALRSTRPSELRPLVDAVKEVNPDFLSGMRSLVE